MLVVAGGVFLAEIPECLVKPAKCFYCFLAFEVRWTRRLVYRGAVCQQCVAESPSLYSSLGLWTSAPRTILELKIIS